MQLSEYLDELKTQNKRDDNPTVKCNRLYKTEKGINCYLTPSEAVQFARHLLAKAQIIMDHQIEGCAVQVWNAGVKNEKLSFGLDVARKGGRRAAKRPQKSN